MEKKITTTSSLILSISHIFVLASVNMDAKELRSCEIKIYPNVSKILSRLVNQEKLVFNFEVHLSDKKLDGLLNPVPMDYFTNARCFTWIPDVPNGLMAYRKFYYDFSIYSFNLLDVYIATPRIDMYISCGKENIQRHDVIYGIFEELKRMLFIDNSHMGESGYMCFLINLSNDMKKNHRYAFETYRRLGINREIVKNYCCELHKNKSHIYHTKSICSGNIVENSMFANYENIVGAVLWAFLPLFISFVSKAKLPTYSTQFTLTQLGHDVSTIKNTLPYESEWINEKQSIYSFTNFISWLFCFHHSNFFTSRLRRFFSILFSLSVIFLDLLMHYFLTYETAKILLHDQIPLGYRALIFGITESYENTDGFFGGPFVWLISYIFFNFIFFIVPTRLSETIAYSTLHQRSTCTFLIQNIGLLQKYGNLDVSTVENYDLLYAIMKANLCNALNPNFWYLIVSTWMIKRMKRIWSYYNERNICCQFVILWFIIVITILFAVFSICELLLCIVYYGIPIVYLLLTLPLSYSKVYIIPLYMNANYISKFIAVILMFISLPFYILWGLYSIYIFLTSFQILCEIMFSTAIAVLAKPDTVGNIWFVAMFFVYSMAIMTAIQKKYHSVLVQSIKLTKNVRSDLVRSKYGEDDMNAELFKKIIGYHFPLRFEIGKSILKMFVIISFFFACNNIISRRDLDLSTFTKITLILMTSFIPKLLSVINTKFDFPISMSDKIIETINVFEEQNIT